MTSCSLKRQHSRFALTMLPIPERTFTTSTSETMDSARQPSQHRAIHQLSAHSHARRRAVGFLAQATHRRISTFSIVSKFAVCRTDDPITDKTAAPKYLPTRNSLLAIATFLRCMREHRERYVFVDFDIPTEQYQHLVAVHAKVDAKINAVASRTLDEAELTLVSVKMGIVHAADAFGRIHRLRRAFIIEDKWAVMLPPTFSETLGYCGVHDAFFEVTLGINMKRFGSLTMFGQVGGHKKSRPHTVVYRISPSRAS